MSLGEHVWIDSCKLISPRAIFHTKGQLNSLFELAYVINGVELSLPVKQGTGTLCTISIGYKNDVPNTQNKINEILFICRFWPRFLLMEEI